jgi:sugar phosphate isomerase/epimerase
MAQPQVACQLIVFGGRDRTDLPGVLREVAAAGYDGYEAGPGEMGTAELKTLLQELDLKLAGVHTGYEGLQDLEDILSYMDALDCHLLMCSGVGSREDGLDAYERAAEVFNDAGRRCQEHGIRFCYHNHSWEFQTYGGVRALDRLYELTDPRYVYLCVDVYWVAHGGDDPAAFLQKHLDRIGTVHFKDMGEDGSFAEVGQGTLDFPAMMEVLSAKPDLDWIIVEQDRTTRTPKESIALSRQYMQEELDL